MPTIDPSWLKTLLPLMPRHMAAFWIPLLIALIIPRGWPHEVALDTVRDQWKGWGWLAVAILFLLWPFAWVSSEDRRRRRVERNRRAAKIGFFDLLPKDQRAFFELLEPEDVRGTTV